MNFNSHSNQSVFYLVFGFFLLISHFSTSQNLIDKYKNGTIKLVEVKSFALDNDWNEIFRTYYDTIYSRPMGNRKSLKVMPDGKVVVNHKYRNFYSIFDKNGKFIKEINIYNSKGKSFQKTEDIAGIIGNNTFYTELDNMGNMTCFDFDGNFKKTLLLDYMTKQMITLSDSKIAVVGWAIWKEKFRDFISIVDYKTNKEVIIWEHFTDRCNDDSHCKLFNYVYKTEENGMFSFSTMPHTRNTGISSPPQIVSIDNKLVVALPSSGEILVYSFDGKLISRDKIDWTSNYLSVEEQKEIQTKAIEKFKNIEFNWLDQLTDSEKQDARKTILAEMKADLSDISKPIPIPTFLTIIKDSDNNLLFFEYPKEESENTFNVWVYEEEGSFVCKSSFKCEEFILQINPSKMVFHNGYIYSIQNKKQTKGNPQRLVKFSLVN